MTKYGLFFTTFFVSLILDQVSKVWIESYFKCPEIPSLREAIRQNKLPRVDEIPIIDGWFSLSHAHNQGAAFGIMQGQMFIFAIFTIIAVVWIGFTVRSLPKDAKSETFALSLILSGAIGNAIDRTRLGYVVDFLRVYTEDPDISAWLIANFKTAEWPSFNIADSAIVVGMIWFLVHSMFFVEDTVEPDEDLEAADTEDLHTESVQGS